MELIAQSGPLNLYYHGDVIMAGTFDDTPMSKEQEIEVDRLWELFLMEFEGRA